MAIRKHSYVVVIEQTHNHGVLVEEVEAEGIPAAFDAACELNDLDPDNPGKYVRKWWAVRGTLVSS